MDVDGLPIGVVVVDRRGRLTAANGRARDLVDGAELLADAVDPADRERVIGHLEHVLATDEGQRTHLELVVGGEPMLLTSTRQGPDAVVIALTEVAALHRQIRELEQRSFTDELTGVANRGLFMRLLAQTLGAAERNQTRTAVLFIDVDNFKGVNDVHGHAAGDAVLVELARRLGTAIRPTDLVARLGGDEFVVLAPDLDDDEAAGVAERVLALCSMPLSVGASTVAVSVSVGVTVEGPGADPETSVSRADTAMYAAKAAGRATSVRWTPQLSDRAPDDPDQLAALRAANRELRSRYEQLRTEARSDARTGLLRDVVFEEHLGALEAAGVACSVVFVDLDHFHDYNARYTHIGGHRVLAAVASALRDRTGVRGSVFRYGGEEFTIVVPRTEATPAEAERLAKQLPEAVAALDLDHETSPFGRVTVSVGVAHSEDASDVTAAANVAMLRAKDTGRNRTLVHRT